MGSIVTDKLKLISHLAVCFFIFLCMTVSLYASDGTGVAAKVNGVIISEAELRAAIDTYIPPGVFHKKNSGDREKMYRKKVLDDLIDRELLFQESMTQGIRASDSDVEIVYEKRIKGFSSKESFYEALGQAGFSVEEFKRLMTKDLTLKKFDEKVRESARYTDKELRSFYDNNKIRFKLPDSYNIGQIFINVPPNSLADERTRSTEKARDLMNRVSAGEDFASLAHSYSEDRYKVKGGDVGWIHEGQLIKEVDRELKGMEKGEVRMVESLYGYHIVELRDRKPSRQKSFEEVRDSLKKDLEQKRYQERRRDLLRRLKDNASIEIVGGK